MKADGTATAVNATSPQITCSMRNCATSGSMPARMSRRRTDAAPPRTRSTPRPAVASGGPNTPTNALLGRAAGVGSDVGRGRSRT